MSDNKKIEVNHMLDAFVACRDAIVRSLLKMRAKQEDVDDILQETYLRAMDAEQKRPISSRQGYLFSVSRNLVLEKLTANSREISMEISDALLENAEASAEHGLHYKRKLQQFNDALSALPENQRRAILLRKFYGLSYRDIAKKMDVSVSSVEKYVASGIKQCKRRLVANGYVMDSYASNYKKKEEFESVDKGGEV